MGAAEKTPLLHVAGGARSASTRYFTERLGVLARPPISSGLDVAALGVSGGGPAGGIGVLVVRPQKKSPGEHAVARFRDHKKKNSPCRARRPRARRASEPLTNRT